MTSSSVIRPLTGVGKKTGSPKFDNVPNYPYLLLPHAKTSLEVSKIHKACAAPVATNLTLVIVPRTLVLIYIGSHCS